MTTRTNLQHRVVQRKAEAQVRQAEYEALSNEEKLKRALSRRGASAKEVGRLQT